MASAEVDTVLLIGTKDTRLHAGTLVAIAIGLVLGGVIALAVCACRADILRDRVTVMKGYEDKITAAADANAERAVVDDLVRWCRLEDIPCGVTYWLVDSHRAVDPLSGTPSGSDRVMVTIKMEGSWDPGSVWLLFENRQVYSFSFIPRDTANVRDINRLSYR